jgi:hypothetical protein
VAFGGSKFEVRSSTLTLRPKLKLVPIVSVVPTVPTLAKFKGSIGQEFKGQDFKPKLNSFKSFKVQPLFFAHQNGVPIKLMPALYYVS